jgi:hypothetical protein
MAGISRSAGGRAAAHLVTTLFMTLAKVDGAGADRQLAQDESKGI